MALLKLAGIQHRFGPRPVLMGVDLEVESGQCAVLYGANGSGKSTLLSILATRLRIQQGQCLLNDMDWAGDGEEIRGRLVFIGHHSHLYGHLTPMENLRFFLDLNRMTGSDETLVRVIAEVGLKDFAHQPVRWFSAGMKKRLALARLLVSQPEMLLLDEPYSALDTHGVVWLNGVITDFQRRGGLVVMASHDPQRVAPLHHRPFHLHQGRLSPMEGEHRC